MEFVEQHRRDALQRGIVEDHPREHALGDDFDAGARRDQALQAHAQADRLADLLAEVSRHARGGGARGEAARLQHDDLAGAGPGLVQQRERNPRRLARAGRRDEHGAIARAQGVGKARKGVTAIASTNSIVFGAHGPPRLPFTCACERFEVGGRAALQNDEGFHRLAPVLVGYSDHGAVAQPGEAADDLASRSPRDTR